MLEKMKQSVMEYSYMEISSFVISIITILSFFILTVYSDTNALLKSHLFWDSLFDGSLVHFYDNFTAANMHNCNLVDRLPLLIWYLPSWMITKLTGCGTYLTFYHQMWHKLFMLIIYMLCIRSMMKICRYFGSDKQLTKYCLLLILASPGTIISVFYAGQDEIVYITFFMLALQHYVEGNRIRYYFWAVWSAVCCPLMLMPYLIITVIDDKKIYSVIGKILLPCIPQLLYSIYFSQCLTYRYTSSDNVLKGYFTTNNIGLGYGTFSILAVILMLIFASAFLYKSNKKDMTGRIRTILYLITVLFAALEIIGWDQFYRKFLWVPFAVLFAVKFTNINTNICFALAAVTDIIQSIRAMYDINIFSNAKSLTSLSYKIFGNIRYVHYTLLKDELNSHVIILNSLIVTCLILFAFFGRKKFTDTRLEFHIKPEQVIFVCSLTLPFLLIYSFACAFVIN